MFNDLDFYLGQILSLCEAKYLGKIFSQTFCFIERQYSAQIKLQIVYQIGCVDAALAVQIFFFDPVALELICNRTTANRLIYESNMISGWKKLDKVVLCIYLPVMPDLGARNAK